MTDIKTEVTAAVEAQAKTLREKAAAFVRAHIPAVVSALAGYGVGATGLIGKVLKHFF